MACGADLAHQFEAGIGNQRRAGVRDQRNRSALRQPLQDLWPRGFRVMFVIGLELRGYCVTLGQTAGDAGVLAGDDVDARQRFQRAKCDVSEIADRGCHQIEAGNRFRGIQGLAADRKCSGGRTRLGVRPVVGTGFCAHNGNLEGSWCKRHIRREGRQGGRSPRLAISNGAAPERCDVFRYGNLVHPVHFSDPQTRPVVNGDWPVGHPVICVSRLEVVKHPEDAIRCVAEAKMPFTNRPKRRSMFSPAPPTAPFE